MRSRRRKFKPKYEIHPAARSPFAQRLTKEKLAGLLGAPLHELNGLVKYKSSFVREKTINPANGKTRHLTVPVGQLRRINERIKFHLNKIELPEYVMSPRKGRAQKQNALLHKDGVQILELDLTKFYPSVHRSKIASWLRNEFRMPAHVAGLFTELVTYNDRPFFGGPASPIIILLAHLEMFDEIHRIALRYGANMSLWVDNFYFSGTELHGKMLEEVRYAISRRGYKTHDIAFRQTNRHVKITGVEVFQGKVLPPRFSDFEIKALEEELRRSSDPNVYDAVARKLLSKLGSQLYLVEEKSPRAIKIKQRMNTLRQKRISRLVKYNNRPLPRGEPIEVTGAAF